MKIESATETTVIAREVTGIPHGGDSGGPLVCDDGKLTVSAIVHQTADVPSTEDHHLEEYNRVDGWVAGFLEAWSMGKQAGSEPHRVVAPNLHPGPPL